MKIEKRTANELIVSGYVNAVDRKSRVLYDESGKPFIEIVKPKTFERALQQGKPVEMRFNHSKHLGSTAENNLELHEDNIGLFARAVITDNDTISKADNFTGWSFTFMPIKDNIIDNADGIAERTLEEIDLLEVSILDKTPAYYGTSVTNVEYRAEDSVKTISETRFSGEIKAEDFAAENADNIPLVNVEGETANGETVNKETEETDETKKLHVSASVEKKNTDNKTIYIIKEMEIELEKLK